MADVRVCAVSDLPSGAVRRVMVDGTPVCVVNLDGELRAIGDTCSHGHYSLSEGELWSEDREIECPKHGSTFSLDDGWPHTLPATQPVPVFAVRVEGDDVLVASEGGVVRR